MDAKKSSDLSIPANAWDPTVSVIRIFNGGLLLSLEDKQRTEEMA